MKCKTFAWQTALPALLLVLFAQAHDPAVHMKEVENPDCAAMKDMGHSKMDMDDPVTQAMMQKCMGEMHQGEAGPDDSKDKHPEPDENDDENNPSKHEH